MFILASEQKVQREQTRGARGGEDSHEQNTDQRTVRLLAKENRFSVMPGQRTALAARVCPYSTAVGAGEKTPYPPPVEGCIDVGVASTE